MARHTNSTIHRSSGFTLVEMLVVVSIVVMLAAITVAFMPRVMERQRASQGASLLQQWLLTSREWAKRDRVPTGIRLQPLGASQIRDMQYIQQPEPFRSTGSVIGPADPPTYFNPAKVAFTGTPINFGPDSLLWPIQAGDQLEIHGGGLLHRIDSIITSGAPSFTCTSLILATGDTPPRPSLIVPYPFSPTEQYRVLRAPRIVAGEPTLQMPQGVAIDLALSIPPPSSSRSQEWDILFAPSGSVILPQATDKIILWVRDVSQDWDPSRPTRGKPGEMTLVTIYSRSGQIAAHPVDTTPDTSNPDQYQDPYRFTRDGRSSGL